MKRSHLSLLLLPILLAGRPMALEAKVAENLTATQWIERGLDLNDNSEEEATCYRQALVLEPDNARAHENLAHVCHVRQQLTDALEHFQRAAEIDPERVEAWHNTSVLLWKVRRDAVGARQAMNRYLETVQETGKSAADQLRQAEASIGEYENMINEQLHPQIIGLYFGQPSPAEESRARIVPASEIVAILSRSRWRETNSADSAQRATTGKGRYDGPCFPLLVFAKNSSSLNDRYARVQLCQLLKALNDPALVSSRFKIIGHADSSGAYANNQILSEKRAQSVVNWLKTHGCRAEMTGEGMGEDLPAYPNTGSLNRRLNRRVEVYRLE